MSVAFYLLAAVAVLGAGLAITLRNVVHAVFSVLLFFSSLAGLFLLLLAEFIAAVQVLVYIGSVGILMLFAIMLTTNVMGDPNRPVQSRGLGVGRNGRGRFADRGSISPHLPNRHPTLDPALRLQSIG